MKILLIWLLLASFNTYAQVNFATIKGMKVRGNLIVFPYPENLDFNFSIDPLVRIAGNIFLQADINGETYPIRSFSNKRLNRIRISGGPAYAFVNEGSNRGGTIVGAGPKFGYNNLTDEELDFYKETFREVGIRFFLAHENYDQISSAVSAEFVRALDVDLSSMEIHAHKCLTENIGISVYACKYFGENRQDEVSRGKFEASIFYQAKDGIPIMGGFSYTILSSEIDGELNKQKYPGFFMALKFGPAVR